MYPEQYIQFLAHFNGDRDYFECHELLEEYWKKSNDRKKDSIWVGFIQMAVSRYHHRRGNYMGAKRTLEKAINILSLQDCKTDLMGLDVNILFPLLSKLINQIDHQVSYQSINLPITDPILLEASVKVCKDKGFVWGQESNLQDDLIVHRHKLRDRSIIIKERMEAQKKRKGNE